MITIKFKVKETNTGKYQIIGTKGYRIVLNNKYDAEKHCDYLNKTQKDMEHFRQQNIEYHTTLTKVKMLAEQIQTEAGEIHVLELAIKIKKLVMDAIS